MQLYYYGDYCTVISYGDMHTHYITISHHFNEIVLMKAGHRWASGSWSRSGSLPGAKKNSCPPKVETKDLPTINGLV